MVCHLEEAGERGQATHKGSAKPLREGDADVSIEGSLTPERADKQGLNPESRDWEGQRTGKLQQ